MKQEKEKELPEPTYTKRDLALFTQVHYTHVEHWVDCGIVGSRPCRGRGDIRRYTNLDLVSLAVAREFAKYGLNGSAVAAAVMPLQSWWEMPLNKQNFQLGRQELGPVHAEEYRLQALARTPCWLTVAYGDFEDGCIVQLQIGEKKQQQMCFSILTFPNGKHLFQLKIDGKFDSAKVPEGKQAKEFDGDMVLSLFSGRGYLQVNVNLLVREAIGYREKFWKQ